MAKQLTTILSFVLLALVGLALYAYLVATEAVLSAAEAVAGAITTLATWGTVAGGVLLSTGVLAGILIALFRVLREQENWLTTKAHRKITERDSNVYHIVARKDEAVYVRDSDPAHRWQPLHLNPSHYQNGEQSAPTPFEIATWAHFHRPAAGAAADLPALGAGAALPDRIDLLDLLPAGRGNLRNLVLGVRTDEDTGQLRNVTAPIWQLVHIANAGATDSGKSNLSRAIAYQVVTADNAQVVFVDLKRQTYKCFKNAEKLLYPIATDVRDFISITAELKAETERRLALFEAYLTVETIHDYNQKAEEPLNYMIMFVDEISNVFMDKEAQSRFLELIRISRATGIYIVATGQSWSHKTLSTDIRQQFRTGFHFGTNDANSSRMILNDSAAVNIERQGRAFVSLPFGLAKSIIEVQTPYLSLESVVQTIDHAGPGPRLAFPEPPAEESLESIKDNEFRELVEAGVSKSEASVKVYGKKYGGTFVTHCRQVLGEI